LDLHFRDALKLRAGGIHDLHRPPQRPTNFAGSRSSSVVEKVFEGQSYQALKIGEMSGAFRRGIVDIIRQYL